MPIPSSGLIAASEDGVGSFDRRGKLTWQVRWDEVTQIALWKVDCLVYDMVCIGFLTAGARAYLVCDEHADGWEEMQPHLLRHFGFKVYDFWNTVIQPPFVENFTVVWKR